MHPSQKRAKLVERAMRLTWGSLESHLIYTHKGRMIRNETNQFHRKSVREYAEIIHILSQLY